MKLTWQSMRKSMDTQNDHARMRIKICINKDQSESGCVPRQRAPMRYQERGLVHNNEYKICHSYHQTRWKTTNSMYNISFKFTFILKKIYLMLGPTITQFISEWINFVNPFIWNYENKFTLILKHFQNPGKCDKMACRIEDGNQFYWKKWDI